jgi:CTP:molybdopterin cytidylyltransferase MocA
MIDVLLTAGGTPHERDPLFAYTQGKPKAALDIAGKPMVQWALDALAAAKSVGQVVLIGLPEKTPIDFPRPIIRLEDQGDMVRNILTGARSLKEKGTSSPYVIVMASDVPAVTGEMIDWLAQQVIRLKGDLVYTVVTKAVMTSQFPGANRSFIRLKDCAVCGGDVNAFKLDAIDEENPIWRRLIDSRKNVLKQAAILGFDTLLLILLRQLTLAQAEQRISLRLGLNGKVLPTDFAAMAMDVDKPHQLALLEKKLALNKSI